MIYNGLKLRHEYKYYIPYADYMAIRSRVSAVLLPDEYMPSPEGYHVRSLYFDDPMYSARFEKVSGYKNRSKTRLRIYNKSLETVKLEKKVKIFKYVGKRTAKITIDELNGIINDDTRILLRSTHPVVHEFYAEQKLKRLRPVIIVDYTREAYRYKPGNVRITFDKDLKAASGNFDTSLSDENLIVKHVYPPGLIAMEVKFDEFLPTTVKNLIHLYKARRVAISKYVLALNAAMIGEKYGLGGIFTKVRAGDNYTHNPAFVGDHDAWHGSGNDNIFRL